MMGAGGWVREDGCGFFFEKVLKSQALVRKKNSDWHQARRKKKVGNLSSVVIILTFF